MGTEVRKIDTVYAMVQSYKSYILEALPRQIDQKRFVRICLNQLTKNPTLQLCTPTSLLGSILQSAAIGLEPDGQMAALVPYKNKGVYECQLQPMYRGLISLSRRSGQVTLFYAECVYENDEFSMCRGLNPDLKHEPTISGDKGGFIGAYAVFRLKTGEPDFEWMSVDEINKIRDRSKAYTSSKKYNKKDTPWITDYFEQAKKTVIKRLSKRAPCEADDRMQQAVLIDNKSDHDKHWDFREVFDQMGAPPPKDSATPETPIAEPQRAPAPSEGKPAQSPPPPPTTASAGAKESPPKKARKTRSTGKRVSKSSAGTASAPAKTPAETPQPPPQPPKPPLRPRQEPHIEPDGQTTLAPKPDPNPAGPLPFPEAGLGQPAGQEQFNFHPPADDELEIY